MNRQSKINQRRADVPKIYRGLYDKAVEGKSLRAGVNAFCLECVSWQREEVNRCTATACPLHPYRPYQRATIPQDARQGADSTPESTNAAGVGGLDLHATLRLT